MAQNRLWLIGLILIIALIVSGTVLFVQAQGIVTQFEKSRPLPGAILRDQNGLEIKRLGTGSIFIPLAKIPAELQTAVIDFMDEHFHKHAGSSKGARTITERLAQLIHTSRGIWGDLQLKVLPAILERRYSKSEILEVFLNQTNFGADVYGVERASQIYFGKSAQDLELAESALLAALAAEPQQADPFLHPEEARQIRNDVLGRMHSKGHLKKDQHDTAIRSELKTRHHFPGRAHFFADHVERLLVDKLGETQVLQGGLQVQTTLDLKRQELAEEIFHKYKTEGALLILNNRGQILAMAGGADFPESRPNQAAASFKDVGSALRPLIYALAVKKSWAQNHIVEDIERDFGGLKITNAANRYWGPVIMKHAAALDLNSACVWTLNELGVNDFIDFANTAGLDLKKGEEDLELAAGKLTGGLSLLDLAQAYQPFINKGESVPLTSIVKVKGQEGEEIDMSSPQKPEQLLSEQHTYLVTDMFRTAALKGAAAPLQLEVPAALSISSSQDNSAQWCLGWTAHSVIAVLVEPSADNRENDSLLAGEIWKEIAAKLSDTSEEGEFTVPENIETNVTIDVFSGLLANSRCPQVETAAFIAGTAPTEFAACALPPAPPVIQPPQEPPTPAPTGPPATQPEPPVTKPPAPPSVPEPSPTPTEPPGETEIPPLEEPEELPEPSPVPEPEEPETSPEELKPENEEN